MRCGKPFQIKAANGQIVRIFRQHHLLLVRNGADLVQHGVPCAPRGVHRQMIPPGQCAHTLDVIDVLMSDQNAAQCLRRHARAVCQLPLDSSGTQPAVHQKAALIIAYKITIACTAAG